MWPADSPFVDDEEAAERAWHEATDSDAYASVFPLLTFDDPTAWCYFRFRLGMSAEDALREHRAARALAEERHDASTIATPLFWTSPKLTPPGLRLYRSARRPSRGKE